MIKHDLNDDCYYVEEQHVEQVTEAVGVLRYERAKNRYVLTTSQRHKLNKILKENKTHVA